jgi:hypothetical protein
MFTSTTMDIARQLQPSRVRTTRPSRLPLLLALLCLTATLAGCAGTNLPGSVKGGECRVFERPQYAVLGKRQYDQRWIDGNVEAGVAACRWKRPAKRPPELDAPKRPKAGTVAPAPAKRPGIVRRTLDRVLPRARPAEAAPLPQPAPLPVSLPEPPEPAPAVVAPPAPPRSALDELLAPSSPVPAAPRSRR